MAIDMTQPTFHFVILTFGNGKRNQLEINQADTLLLVFVFSYVNGFCFLRGEWCGIFVTCLPCVSRPRHLEGPGNVVVFPGTSSPSKMWKAPP